MKKKRIIKFIVLLVILITVEIIDSVCGQIAVNQLALQQMENTIDSSFWIYAYTYFSRYKKLIIMIIIAAALL